VVFGNPLKHMSTIGCENFCMAALGALVKSANISKCFQRSSLKKCNLRKYEVKTNGKTL
jgi:hypothetical protein